MRRDRIGYKLEVLKIFNSILHCKFSPLPSNLKKARERVVMRKASRIQLKRSRGVDLN